MKKTNRKTIGYFGVFFMLGAVVSSLGPTLPQLAENVGVGLAQIGVLFTTRSFGYLLGSLISGTLYDRVPGHRLMGGLLLLAAVMLVLMPRAGILILLASVAFLVGFSLGGIDVGSNTLMALVHKGNSGPYLNALFFFAGVGGFLIPLLLAHFSLIGGYTVMSLALLPVAAWLFLTPSPPLPDSRGETHGKVDQLGFFILFILLGFLYVGFETSYGGWIFTYVTRSQAGSEAIAYQTTSAFWLALTAGRLLAIPLAARFQSKNILLGYILAAILFAAVLVLIPPVAWVTLIGTIGIGLSTGAVFPTAFTYVQKRFRLSGRLTGIVWAFGSVGAMTSPWAVGQLIDSRGPEAMMVAILLIWIVALLIVLAMRRLTATP
jgi:FHS family Na+ dependent glucose MFS transporter 1